MRLAPLTTPTEPEYPERPRRRVHAAAAPWRKAAAVVAASAALWLPGCGNDTCPAGQNDQQVRTGGESPPANLGGGQEVRPGGAAPPPSLQTPPGQGQQATTTLPDAALRPGGVPPSLTPTTAPTPADAGAATTTPPAPTPPDAAVAPAPPPVRPPGGPQPAQSQ
jgi:hypothetical protein